MAAALRLEAMSRMEALKLRRAEKTKEVELESYRIVIERFVLNWC